MSHFYKCMGYLDLKCISLKRGTIRIYKRYFPWSLQELSRSNTLNLQIPSLINPRFYVRIILPVIWHIFSRSSLSLSFRRMISLFQHGKANDLTKDLLMVLKCTRYFFSSPRYGVHGPWQQHHSGRPVMLPKADP